MHLLFISQLFDPEYSIKGLGYLSSLSKTGVTVDVITTYPSYPTGKVFDGYKVKLWDVEYQDGIRIIRVFSIISHSKSKILRALNYVSFSLFALIASLVIKKADVVYAYHPQLTIGLVACCINLFKKTPFITDVQDLWPDALIATGVIKEGRTTRIIGEICHYIYKTAAHVVVLSEGYKEALEHRGVNPDKISVIYNWNCDEGFDPGKMVNAFGDYSQYKYKFVYAGNLGAAQALKAVIDAFFLLKDESACLIIIGSGVEQLSLMDYARLIQSPNVFFLGYVPANEIKGYLHGADVLVIHVKDAPIFKITIPSKVQASLNAGKPILIAVGGEANRIIEEARAGLAAVPEDCMSIADAVRKLIDRKDEWPDMGKNAKRYYVEKMSQDVALKKSMLIFNSLPNKWSC